jgi:predicted transposase YdaD
MAQQYDVSLKLLFRWSTGLVARALFGGRIREWVNVELPRVQNPRVDLLARMTDGSLRHVEIESRASPDLARRQAEYYLGLHRRFNEHIEQVVLYVGSEPARSIKTKFQTPAMRFQFRLIDIRDFDGEPLLNSLDLTDNMLALLTRTDRTRVMQRVEERLVKLEGKEQESAAQLFVLISGLRGLEDPVARRLSMIDLMENKVFRRVLRKGRAEGKAEGKAEFLAKMLEAKFGAPLPAPVMRRISAASSGELEHWLVQAVQARRLQDTFK